MSLRLQRSSHLLLLHLAKTWNSFEASTLKSLDKFDHLEFDRKMFLLNVSCHMRLIHCIEKSIIFSRFISTKANFEFSDSITLFYTEVSTDPSICHILKLDLNTLIFYTNFDLFMAIFALSQTYFY
jgi:hypothetical protein